MGTFEKQDSAMELYVASEPIVRELPVFITREWQKGMARVSPRERDGHQKFRIIEPRKYFSPIYHGSQSFLGIPIPIESHIL